MQEVKNEIYKQLEELRQREMQNNELLQTMEQMEEETYWQMRRAKEINDDLFEAYAKDKRLLELLAEKEDRLHKKQVSDRLFLEDMLDELRKQQMQIEDSKTACQIQLEQKE